MANARARVLRIPSVKPLSIFVSQFPNAEDVFTEAAKQSHLRN